MGAVRFGQGKPPAMVRVMCDQQNRARRGTEGKARPKGGGGGGGRKDETS